MLKILEKYDIKIHMNTDIYFKHESIETLANLLQKKIKKRCTLVKENLAVSRQSGPNCYFVAGLEMLLSSKTFLRFLDYYVTITPPAKDSVKWSFANIEFTICGAIGITPPIEFCKLILQYIKCKTIGGLNSIYSQMEELLYKDSQYPKGEQDDVNVVLMYLQRSFLFSLLYSKRGETPLEKDFLMFEYGPYYQQTFVQEIASPFVIFMIIGENRRTVIDTLDILNETQVISVVTKYGGAEGGHYEIYQHINNRKENVKKFIAKNTSSLYSTWTYLYILCMHRDAKSILSKIEYKNTK